MMAHTEEKEEGIVVGLDGAPNAPGSLATPPSLDAGRNRFPYCVVWSPLPIITWFLPFIGHTGICTSSGVIYDFAGPYTINEDNMAFGRPTKYWQLSPSGVYGVDWDAAVRAGNEVYKKRMHNLLCDNCHSHVAYSLNEMNYRGSMKWNMVKVGLLIFLHGHYISFGAWLRTWLPFVFLVGVALVFVFLV